MNDQEVNQAIRDYAIVRGAWQRAADKENAAKLAADQFKAGIKDLEAEILANGGYQAEGGNWYAIDGKNAEIREAQLAMAMRAHPMYEEAIESMEQCQRDLARYTVEREDAEHEMRRIRVAVEYATAVALREAYADRPLMRTGAY